mgnify:FL=1
MKYPKEFFIIHVISRDIIKTFNIREIPLKVEWKVIQCHSQYGSNKL